jgi:hypothetical protein
MGDGIDTAGRNGCAGLEVNGEIVGLVLRKVIGAFFREDIHKLMILRRNCQEIRAGRGSRGGPGLHSGVKGVERNLELGGTRESGGPLKCSRVDESNRGFRDWRRSGNGGRRRNIGRSKVGDGTGSG